MIHRLPTPVRYLISGGLAASVNLATLYILADIFGIWYLSASVTAFTVALIASFTLHKFVTFGDRRMEIAQRQFFSYMCATVINVCLNALLMFIFTDLVGFYHMISQVIASGMIAVTSFFVYRYIVFRRPVVEAVEPVKAL